jgi:lipoate-protein ligase A
MAADEALATSLLARQPVLRVYSWQPWTISVGYHQDLNELDLEKCRRDDVGIVRRPTGGRAILHAHELTYSVILPRKSAWFHRKGLEIYNHISGAMVKGLSTIGLPVLLEKNQSDFPETTQYQDHFSCFATTARYEVQYDSKKMIGSAQRRFKNAVLQHGSIMLGNAHLDLVHYVNSQTVKEAREALEEKTVSVETILRRDVTYEEIVSKLKTGFEDSFEVACLPAPFTEAELSQINQLLPKFSDPWRSTS